MKFIKRLFGEQILALDQRISDLEQSLHSLKQDYDEKCVLLAKVDQAIQQNTQERAEWKKKRQNRGSWDQRRRFFEQQDALLAKNEGKS